MCINITQVGTKWHLKGFPINYSRLLFTLTLAETCTLNWCRVGTQPPAQSGVRTFMTVFFFCPRLQQPEINLGEDLDSVNPTYFQATVRMKSFTLRWRVTARGEYNGRHYCHSQTFITTEMEMMVVFFYPSEDPDLTMQRMEKLRMEKYKSYILISKNRVSLSGDQSVSALRAWRISHWVRLMTSRMHSSNRHKSPRSSAFLVWEPLFQPTELDK